MQGNKRKFSWLKCEHCWWPTISPFIGHPHSCIGNIPRELKWLVTQSLILKARRLHHFCTFYCSCSYMRCFGPILWQPLEVLVCPKVYNKRNSQENLESSSKALCDHPYFLWILLTTAILKSFQISDKTILTLKKRWLSHYGICLSWAREKRFNNHFWVKFWL